MALRFKKKIAVTQLFLQSPWALHATPPWRLKPEYLARNSLLKSLPLGGTVWRVNAFFPLWGPRAIL